MTTLPRLASLAILVSSLSCTRYRHDEPTTSGLTAADAQTVAIRAVRTAERNSKLELKPFLSQARPNGDYVVALQRKTSDTTADHWRVIVHPNRSAEVLPIDPAQSTPETLPAHPAPLQGDRRQPEYSTPPRLLPSE